MQNIEQETLENIERLKLLAQQYPNIREASTEMINLSAISNLPKGTEHFISDLHGEYETFRHIMNNGSGTIREKVDILFESTLSFNERAALSTLIYYPKEKIRVFQKQGIINEQWYRLILNRLLEVCRLVASKYTRSKVRKALPNSFAYIIEELLHNSPKDLDKVNYYTNIIETIIEIDQANHFIIALCNTIKRLAVDHLHIIGDIFDRGPRPDKILDDILDHHSIDIQWGNHDVVWMSAASGSEASIAVVLANSIGYNNLKFLEEGYGINLRPLAIFANDIYKNSSVERFIPSALNSNTELTTRDIDLIGKMNKAISIIRFKLEGQIIKRRPEFDMMDRLLLDKIDFEHKTITINNKAYLMLDCDYPTLDRNDPYKLSTEEQQLIDQLKSAFLHSEKLQRHTKFLYEKGSLYKNYNSNLLFHGCIPMNPDQTLKEFNLKGKIVSGKSLLDEAQLIARDAYFEKNKQERIYSQDFLWFLWCGKHSPLFGKDKMTSFERAFINDPELIVETKNEYYTTSRTEEGCMKLLENFGLNGKYSHIINGHVPVKSGHDPIRANGRLIIIDGGFCKAYQPRTGIAGYTLIYNSQGIRLCAHEPFEGSNYSIENNLDIHSTSVVSQKASNRIKVSQTDKGEEIKLRIKDLNQLIFAYKEGYLTETKSIGKEFETSYPHFFLSL